MENSTKLNEPLPLFYHKPSGRVLYMAPGRYPLIFAIAVADAVKHEAVNQGPVQQPATHPFGLTTVVASLRDLGTRRGLADTTEMEVGVLENTLTLWCDFCDALAEHLAEGMPVASALANTWRLEDATDVDLHDVGRV